ncbi:tRNA 2-selenouridine(34) synthase MnmH [Campylobacter sp. RM12647]|uniref:tRNA 2-selenouridine(34) synthase MnmH n=1 Tax=Campylobacter sp. RM12647 TaxID=2735737 RepID=UPI001DE7D17B|nr:tRNA 2-selenouridine(34) synthase MnmH [Campylobacter sp. RM12647]
MQLISAKEFLNINKNILIDARSPNEYKKAHLKKALNFFALNNEEHKLVGTKYATNKFNAKLLGASFICKNTSIHLKKIQNIANPHKDEIYIYCARGGQRSGAIGHILSEIGFKVYKCEGGFKELRNEMISYLNSYQNPNFVSLAGNTACGKTRLLKLLDNKIDLEKLAHHFGSTFGSRGFLQPSQQQFDINLINELKALKDAKVFIEAESKNIGTITLFNNFYEQMNSGIKVFCEASLDIRVQNCVNDYQNISSEFFYFCLERLKPYLGNALVYELSTAYNNKDLKSVAKILLINYYDKVYKKPKEFDLLLNLDDLEKAKNELMKL